MLFVCKYDESISMKSNSVNYELGVRDRAVRWNNGGADDTRALSRLASDWQRSAGRHPRPPTCPPGSQTGTGTIIAGDHLYPEPYKRLPRRGYAHQPARHRAHTLLRSTSPPFLINPSNISGNIKMTLLFMMGSWIQRSWLTAESQSSFRMVIPRISTSTGLIRIMKVKRKTKPFYRVTIKSLSENFLWVTSFIKRGLRDYIRHKA